MPGPMAIVTTGLLPSISVADRHEVGDIARRIIRADGLPCAFHRPAPLPLTERRIDSAVVVTRHPA